MQRQGQRDNSLATDQEEGGLDENVGQAIDVCQERRGVQPNRGSRGVRDEGIRSWWEPDVYRTHGKQQAD
jgi:hypothetical protein